MTLFLIFLVVFFVSNVYENYCREKEQSDPVTIRRKLHGKFWHWFQWAGWAVTIFYVSYSLFEFWLAVRVTLFLAACWWILYDGALNSLNKRWFFKQSIYTTSDFEPLAHPWVKIIFLIITILLLVLL